MNDYLLLKFLHIVGLAYWLGGDLGVFYSSFTVSNESAPAKVRVAAAKMLFALDQAPRLCMTMMLPLGIHLAWDRGVLPLDAALIVAIWVAAFIWAGSVLFLHFGSGDAAKSVITKIDYWFRIAVIVALLSTGIGALSGSFYSVPYWVAWKLIIFGLLISLGLVIRVLLKDFGPAFAKLAAGQASDIDNATIRQALGRTRPFVVCIWVGLLVSAALGLHLL